MKNKKIIILILFITFCLSLLFICNNTKKHNKNLTTNVLPSLPINSGSQQNKIPSIKTTLEINQVDYTDTIVGQMSVYDFMSQLRSEGKINFTEQDYTGMGKFIQSINGVSGNENKSWIYYVNGVEAQVGVSNYKIKPGDLVSFKYEKSDY